MFSKKFRAANRRLAATMLAATIFSASTAAFAGTLTGFVIDGSGTSGLQGAEVEIVELGRTTSAGPDGDYRFADIPAGTYTVVVRYTGAEDKTQSVTVTETGTTSANIILSAYGNGDSTILVIGQHANLGSSISRQRAADGVSTVLTRDAVGQFPDQNVAEALRRAPGINVLNDQGEGRFVSVRGLDPNLNSTSINGNRVLATGGDERAAALDVIPSELVESIEIKKTLTPDMDGDTLGGSIEINTTSAFDRKKGFVSMKAEGSYNDLQDVVSPKVGLDFSTRLGENLGISGGLNYNKRIFGSDNIEMDGWEVADNGIVYAEDLEYRDYDVTRERIGGSLSLDARLGSTTELYARGVYSRFDDLEYRRRLIFGFDGEPASGSDTTATFDSADDRIEVRRDLKDRREIQTIKTISLGGKTETGPWRVTYDAAWSEARQFEDGSVDPIRFRQRFQEPGALGVTIDSSDLQNPFYTINYGEAAFLDPSLYRPSLFERTTDEDARDREYSLRADVARSFGLDKGTFEVQSGIKARFRKKSLDFTIDLFDEFDDGGFTLADVLGKQTYGLAFIDPIPGPGQWSDFYDANGTNGMERNPLESEWVSAAEDYSAKEDILAGYLMGRFDNSIVRIIGGVRVERTRNDFLANWLTVNEDDETLEITPIEFKRDYTDWLPSLNVRYAPARNVVLRGGVFRSVMRPKLSDIAPRFVVEENEEGEREGTFGNPDLTPYRAWNFDITAEYYFARNAVVQGGFFYKQIDDFIVEANFEGTPEDPFVFNGIEVLEGTVPINGERAKVKGFEFSYQQSLDFLPGLLDGLLVNVNYTYTDAEGKLADGDLTNGRSIPLAASSKHTLNAVLGYEKGPVSLRLSGAYRSGYLDEVGGDADEDRYAKKHFQLDLSGKYQLTDNIQLVGELVNILDEPYTAYQRFEGRDRLLQYEEYGITAKFGVRASF